MSDKSYYDDDIGVSLQMPTNWEAGATDQFPLILMAPPENGFRANLSFSIKDLNPPTPEHLQQTIDAARASRQDSYDGFELVSEQRVMIDNFPGHIERYHWTMDHTGQAMTQLFALILTGPDALYGMHGTCLRDAEDTYVPAFESIIQSMRFIAR